MTAQGVQFTQEDRLVMKSYGNMLEGLAQYLGDGYELVLHSLEDVEDDTKVIYGGPTGTRPGRPQADVVENALRRLHSNEEEELDSVCFNTSGNHGEPLHCTAIAIRGRSQRVIGVLCISFFMNVPFQSVLRGFTARDPRPYQDGEPAMRRTDDIVRDAVDRAVMTVDAEGVVPSLRNRQIISLLYDEGIFNIKEAVCCVADQLGLSKNTVYLHLRHSKGLE